MKDARAIEPVVRHGLCTGCGTCVGMCPRDAVEMVIDHRRGLYVPRVNDEKCNECGLCLDVCPGHAVDFRQLSRDIFGEESGDAVLGHFIGCYMGHAADHHVRYSSASGGLVSALLIFALEEGLIDGALVTRMREDRPLEPQPFIARTRQEILSAARSKYCPVPANVALREILASPEGERFAVVGLPCHVQGIRKAQVIDKKLKEKIVACFGLVCSHTDSFHETDFLLRKYGVRKEVVAGIDYRGRGWPGYLSIRTKQGTDKAVPFDEYIKPHAGCFFMPRRCTLCCDMAVRLADISFMDAWLPEVKARDNVGTSIIVCRTEEGEAMCRSARSKQIVELKELSRADVLRSQGRARMANRHLQAHTRFARLHGISIPNYTLDVPQSGPLNYLRALVTHLNILIGSMGCLQRLISPLIWIESRVFRRVKNYI